MAQAKALISTLKKVLKSRGLTYLDVAQALGLSEASVKRLFARENLSLDRLDLICQLAGLEISDLVKEMTANQRRVTELTQVQELELVSDPKLLLVAFLVVNHWRHDEILSRYDYTEPALIGYLAHLDKLKLIEMLPGNRFRLLISPNFTWRQEGPIQQFFNTHMRQGFLDSQFNRRGETFMFLSGMLSHASNDMLIHKLQRLVDEFNEMTGEDESLPLERRFGSSLLVALRPWEPEVFRQLRRT